MPGADALDRYFINHPDALLGPRRTRRRSSTRRTPRSASATCAPRPTSCRSCRRDDELLGAGALEAAEALVEAGELVRTPGGLAWRGAGSPAGQVSLRSGTTDAIAVVERASGTLLGMLEPERAFSTVHEGAVYLHRGETYLAETLDLADRVALVSPFNGPWYTQPRRETETSIVRALVEPELRCGVELTYGVVEVSDQVVAYERRSLPEQRRLDTIPLDLPARHFETRALWFVPPDELMEEVGGDLLGALHAAEHALISVLPLLAMCDRWDIGGLSTNIHPQTLRPTVFVYDGHAGGVGHRAARPRPLRRARRERGARRRRVPLPRRLSLVRAVAEVRQPQRDARQGRRRAAAGCDGRGRGRQRGTALSAARSARAPDPARPVGRGAGAHAAACARSRSRSAQSGQLLRRALQRVRRAAAAIRARELRARAVELVLDVGLAHVGHGAEQAGVEPVDVAQQQQVAVGGAQRGERGIGGQPRRSRPCPRGRPRARRARAVRARRSSARASARRTTPAGGPARPRRPARASRP